MISFVSHSPRETEQLAERIAKSVSGSTVIALFGGLGMGKTTFASGFARGLEISDPVSSPTFALVNEYHGKKDMYHFDMYRIESWEDLYSTGFFDYYDAGQIIVCEWSENIENALPENTIRISIKRGSSDSDRIIEIDGNGKYENFKY